MIFPPGLGWSAVTRLPCPLSQPAHPYVSAQAGRRDPSGTHGALLSVNIWHHRREDDLHPAKESRWLGRCSWWTVLTSDTERAATGKDVCLIALFLTDWGRCSLKYVCSNLSKWTLHTQNSWVTVTAFHQDYQKWVISFCNMISSVPCVQGILCTQK